MRGWALRQVRPGSTATQNVPAGFRLDRWRGHDAELDRLFADFTATLQRNETRSVAELNGVQGQPVDIHGYYPRTRNASAARDAVQFDIERGAAGAVHERGSVPTRRRRRARRLTRIPVRGENACRGDTVRLCRANR